jgi:hypothetical protein
MKNLIISLLELILKTILPNGIWITRIIIGTTIKAEKIIFLFRLKLNTLLMVFGNILYLAMAKDVNEIKPNRNAIGLISTR